MCGSFDFGKPLTARVSGTDYDTEHILEFQLPKQFLDRLDSTLGAKFEHPDPGKTHKVNGQDVRDKVRFCEYFKTLWDIRAINVGGKTRTPVQHIAACYPTKSINPHQLIVLEHEINIPTKGKVGRGPKEQQSRSTS